MALARVCWVPETEGGRRIPPTGHRYVMVAKFADDNTWPDEAWSLVVDLSESPLGSHCTTANVRFLVPQAPVHLLTTGSKFELFEGRRCVATGEILADQRRPSESLTA
jgi:hypothetical protein